MEFHDIGVADLKLDVQNPRHTPVHGQREAIDSLLAEAGDKILHLAEDIAEHGVSPLDTLAVLKGQNDTFVVLEGNRRVTAVKLLTNPNLASAFPSLEKRFAKLARASVPPASLRCVVFLSREEAKHWQLTRHSGEMGGVGVVPWNAESASRFNGGRRGQVEMGVILVDAIQRTWPSDKDLQKCLSKVRKDRISTLGRLASDPWIRDQLGIRIVGSDVSSHYHAKDLAAPIRRMMTDLSNNVTVTDLKTKDQRRLYYEKNIKQEMPDPANRKPDVSLLTPDAKGKTGPSPKPPPTPPTPPLPPTPAKPLFGDVQLANLGVRVAALLAELKAVDVIKAPNSAAALIRVLIELAVFRVYELNGLQLPPDLKTGVKYCVNQLDPQSKNQKYTPVRTGLQDGTSMLAVKTMQAYMHNAHFNPLATELRSLAENYSPFLSGLDSLV